jgi:hypothetical protein
MYVYKIARFSCTLTIFYLIFLRFTESLSLRTPEEFAKMQQSILTRYTALALFLFTCCLTVDVNARERDLGPRLSPSKATKLTPEALRLLSDANALLEGFTPAKVTPFELTPRRKVKKTMPVKMANSRVKVKFADELQIRLDVHNQLYSKTGRTSSAVADLVDALGVTLSPVHTDSQASIDALIRRAELQSGKQQPDLSGTYWLDGDQTSVDVAAELFYIMEEVEWVMYKPLLIRPTGPTSQPEAPSTNQAGKNPQQIHAKAQTLAPVFGACWFGNNVCEAGLDKYDCIDFGGTFLGKNSICPEKKSRNSTADYVRDTNPQVCDSFLSPDDKERMQRMLDDGTWDSYRSGENNNALRGGSIVNMTVHIVRNSDGTGGLNEQAFIVVLNQHNITAAATGLTWCIKGNFLYHDSDSLVEQAANGAQITEGFVDNTVNVYCVPALQPGVAGFACFPPSTCFSVTNDAIQVDLGTFSHEMGHYFNLLHTFDNDLGDECVDESNCGIAGDLICDTPADPTALTGGNPQYDPGTCLYTGVLLDACGSGNPYAPLMNNILSYYSGCRTAFTAEQINVIIAVALNERSNLVTVTCNNEPVQLGACCMGDNSCIENQTQTDCDNAGGIYQGANVACGDVNCEDPGPDLLVAICCLYEAAAGQGPGCVDISQDDCLEVNGIYMPAEEPDEGETICEIFTDCPEGEGPIPFPTDCGEFAEYTTYFAGDCYIDQVNCSQDNRPLGSTNNTPGCLDTPETILNGNYVVVTNAPDGPDTTYLDQSCCTNIMESVPYCAANPWDALCSSTAISYAVEGGKGCQREIQESDQINCTAAFGGTQGRSRQPRVLTAYVGSNLNVIYDLPTAVAVQYEIIEDGGRYLNLYFDGVVAQQNLSGQSISQTGTWIELTAATFGVSVTAQCCAWTGCCQGEDPPTDFCEQELANVCSSSATWLSTLPVTTLADDTHLYASFISSAGAACTSFAGSPSIPHVVPSPASGPDFAEIGLLTWMSQEMIPNLDPVNQNLKPLPSSTNLLTANEVLQAQQLMPWPIGGFNGTSICPEGSAPPILSPGGTINWGGEGLELFPDPGNPGGFGQSDVYKGAYGYGQKWADDDGDINIVNGAFGNNVKVAVLDWSAHLQAPTNDVGVDMGGIHAELTHVILEGEDTGHDPLNLIFDENLTDQWYPFSADHGTGVLGIIGAQWGPNSGPGASLETRLANNVGVLGMVPDAELYFFPLATVQDPTGRQETAWIHAMATLGAGDVLCAAYRPVVSNETWPNLNYLDDMNNYLEIANNLGICTVIAAGNQGVDLGSIDPDGGDQGAIVATAVSPGLPYKRWCTGSSASNYSTSSSYEVVTASGWGMGVTTCGKGPNRDNFLGYSTCIYEDPTNAHDVHSYAYTNNFDNTGAAAATVAGAVAIVEGFTRQIFDIPMSPTVMRQLIAGGRYEGVDREGNPIMPFRDYSSEDNSSECELPEPNPLDWDLCAPDETGWRTGSLVDPLEAMRNTIYDPIFNTPNIETLIIIRGTYHLGNIYSLAGDDGNLFGVSGVSTGANVEYSIPAEVPGEYVRYPSPGNVTDIYLTGELETTLPSNNELIVEINFEETQPDRFYLRCEMWDYRRRSWEQASATTVVENGTEDVELTIESASRFIDRTTTQYHLRLTTAVTNLPGSGSQPPYPIMYDQILVKTGLTQVPRP